MDKLKVSISSLIKSEKLLKKNFFKVKIINEPHNQYEFIVRITIATD